ncbi:FIST signal transduction protein [Shewanella woodyi]|uniref:FIST C domain protein n=1 Tax=Shewanella woodyi (strain ATCC 51908 / MS32) TaxID=392500 RepID=B1KMS7_SHEWM|nr:FIST N-terminal domain-containing protein [Shewanella woodyi]ACA87455.1 domain of unknown function DUF1745 [Shewanella woodyi ATCC 51908]
MKTFQTQWHDNHWAQSDKIEDLDSKQTLILIFGEIHLQPDAIAKMKSLSPNACITGCSTAGEIQGRQVNDDSLIATIIAFEKTNITMIRGVDKPDINSKELGVNLANQLNETDNLCHVLVLSDGLGFNASHLIEGMTDILGLDIQVSGGLAGDRHNFVKTHLLFNDEVTSSAVIAIGFYGEQLEVSCGTRGGWCSFGIERRVTQAENNMLVELDDENALSIYKSYLGELAEQLPASGLRFPLEISEPNKITKVVRTLLAVDEETGTLTFAGNIPTGATAQLMRSNVESLIQGSLEAGKICRHNISSSPQVAILISCVGRKLVLKQLVEDEIEVISEELGEQALLCGFYSYGEIAPYDRGCLAELHNQTMTITAFAEI